MHVSSFMCEICKCALLWKFYMFCVLSILWQVSCSHCVALVCHLLYLWLTFYYIYLVCCCQCSMFTDMSQRLEPHKTNELLKKNPQFDRRYSFWCFTFWVSLKKFGCSYNNKSCKKTHGTSENFVAWILRIWVLFWSKTKVMVQQGILLNNLWVDYPGICQRTV